MGFLRLLEGIRHPIADTFFSVITYMGYEIFFMVVALVLFWCISKRRGYYLFSVCFFGLVLNQFLKLWFRVPRPWAADPDFTIVESARAAAAGYAFPSGHTQNIVGTAGVLLLTTRRTWVRVICVVLAILVPFSRLYLGVHYPLDVGVAFLISAALVAALWPFFRDEVGFRNAARSVLAALVLASLLYCAFVLLYRFPADLDAENYAVGLKNGYVMIGCSVGLFLDYIYDRHVLQFDTRAPFIGQVLKLVLGLALILAIRFLLKAPLLALFRGHGAADGVRYFLMVIFGGCIWPHTFPLFARLGRKKV